MSKWAGMTVAGVALLLAMGAAAQDEVRFTAGPALLEVDFSSETDWELYEQADSGIFSGVRGGQYVVTVGVSGFSYGLGEGAFVDTVLDVDAALLSAEVFGQYGAGCRVDNSDGSGYFFLIDADHYFSIVRSDAGATTRLIFGQAPDVATDGMQRLRAVCVGEYLALYLGDRLLAETRDATYLAGQPALVVSKSPATEQPVEAVFDNLALFEALPGPDLEAPLAAAQARAYTLGAELQTETFDAPDVWENYSFGNVNMRVEAGFYRATSSDDRYIWAQDTQVNTDVVIEVEATELSQAAESEYGVMCRADVGNNGLGYYFMISRAGDYQIAIAGETLLQALSGGSRPEVVNPTGVNLLRVVCIEDYLALYVNDQFLTSVTDSTYRDGVVAFAVQGENEEIDVVFDNLVVREAQLD